MSAWPGLKNYAHTSGSFRHNKKSHPGFKAVAGEIAARTGYSQERAAAILASKTRGASKAAKKANPRLKRVKG